MLALEVNLRKAVENPAMAALCLGSSSDLVVVNKLLLNIIVAENHNHLWTLWHKHFHHSVSWRGSFRSFQHTQNNGDAAWKAIKHIFVCYLNVLIIALCSSHKWNKHNEFGGWKINISFLNYIFAHVEGCLVTIGNPLGPYRPLVRRFYGSCAQDKSMK